MTPQQLLDRLMKENAPDYLRGRVLPDDTIAIVCELPYTRSIILDCDLTGYGSRFCFKDRWLADKRFDELQSADDVPEGFIARR